MGVIGQFYLIKQDERVANTPEILGFSSNIFQKQQLNDKSNTLYVKDKMDINYTDFMEYPLLLVSDMFKSVIKIYQEDYEYKAVVLTEKEQKVQKVYWNIILPETDVLSSESLYYPDRTLRKIVIDQDKARNQSFFKITNNLRTLYIMRLDLAESLLRRKLCGFLFEEVQSV